MKNLKWIKGSLFEGAIVKKAAVFAAVMILISAVSAFAVSIDLRTDFIISSGLNSFYYADAGLTLTAFPGEATLYQDTTEATLYQDTTDGIGVIYSYEVDEIEGSEFLNLHFDEERYLTSILITDLFTEPYNDRSGTFSEIGYYSFNYNIDTDVGDWTEMIAPVSNAPSPVTNGELEIIFDPIVVSDIWFSAPGLMNLDSDKGVYLEGHEFSVARIDVHAVPEPSTLLLLGSGLIGLAAFRKKTIS